MFFNDLYIVTIKPAAPLLHSHRFWSNPSGLDHGSSCCLYYIVFKSRSIYNWQINLQNLALYFGTTFLCEILKYWVFIYKHSLIALNFTCTKFDSCSLEGGKKKKRNIKRAMLWVLRLEKGIGVLEYNKTWNFILHI